MQQQINLQSAVNLLQNRQYEAALIMLQEISKLQVANADVFNLLGVAYRHCDDNNSSRKSFKKSIRLNPNNPSFYNNMGNLYTQEGKLEKAKTCFIDALKIDNSFIDALNNLGLTYQRLGSFEKAKEQFIKLTTLNNRHFAGFASLGLVHQELGELEQAVEAYDKCLFINDKYLIALHNKAVSLKLQNKFEEAIQLFHKVLTLNPNIADTHQNLGSCYASQGQPEQAKEEFKIAVTLDPLSASQHHWYNQMLWSEGDSEFLKSYDVQIKTTPTAHHLRRELVFKLSLANRLDEALEHSSYLVEKDANFALNFKLHGEVLRKKRKFTEAVSAHQRGVKLARNDSGLKEELATSYLSNGDVKAAMPLIEQLIKSDSNHQGYIALKTTALRIDQSDEYFELCDYEKLILKTKIETPPGFSTLKEFNTALAEHLKELHVSKEHPLDQSLISGTQTIGNLFNNPHQVVSLLKDAFDEKTMEFIKQLPSDTKHPTLRRNTQNYSYTGAWSVLLRNSGFHLNHFHSVGWYSGPYYVELPDEINDESQQGWVKFGEPGFECIVALPADLIVKPEPGLMVRFPSYVWHGTNPFKSEQKRLVVALDIEPQQ